MRERDKREGGKSIVGPAFPFVLLGSISLSCPCPCAATSASDKCFLLLIFSFLLLLFSSSSALGNITLATLWYHDVACERVSLIALELCRSGALGRGPHVLRHGKCFTLVKFLINHH